jgi:hypothetical protein
MLVPWPLGSYIAILVYIILLFGLMYQGNMATPLGREVGVIEDGS